MVLETQTNTYQCEICELHFTSKRLAEECESWCSNHESCNYPIASQSLEASKQAAPQE